jgi:hypothetical protein
MQQPLPELWWPNGGRLGSENDCSRQQARDPADPKKLWKISVTHEIAIALPGCASTFVDGPDH